MASGSVLRVKKPPSRGARSWSFTGTVLLSARSSKTSRPTAALSAESRRDVRAVSLTPDCMIGISSAWAAETTSAAKRDRLLCGGQLVWDSM